MPFTEYSHVISVSFNKEFNVYEVTLNYSHKPEPGQFVSLVFPNEAEVPLTVGDYDNEVLTLYIESQRVVSRLKRNVIVKGPLGRPISRKVKRVLGIIKDKINYLDLKYALKVFKKDGAEVKLICLTNCKIDEVEMTNDLENYDLILASVPESFIEKLPLNALVYVRWVKMNCGLGVCGECNYKGLLPCIEGPFVEVREIVD